MLRIDSHQHFWQYDPAQYGWINPDMGILMRDFLPADLQKEIAPAGMSGVVSVQAIQTVAETRWLLELARRNNFIRGVVGWVPLIEPDVMELLHELAASPKLVAIRHVLQDEPDPMFMLRDDFNRGIRLLKDLELVYDILIFERHLPQTLSFVDRHEGQVFVIDHLAKPRVREGEISAWRENIRELAKRPNTYCKLSGLVTEAHYRTWTAEQLKPYIETILLSFGPARIMFGSDWPVCLLASGYKQWVDVVDAFIGSLSGDEQQRIWSGTAIEAYGLA